MRCELFEHRGQQARIERQADRSQAALEEDRFLTVHRLPARLMAECCVASLGQHFAEEHPERERALQIALRHGARAELLLNEGERFHDEVGESLVDDPDLAATALAVFLLLLLHLLQLRLNVVFELLGRLRA